MNDDKQPPADPAGSGGRHKDAGKSGREERLAAALRENLRRRKAQQRRRKAPLKAIKNDDPI